MNSVTIAGRNYLTVQSKIEHFTGMLNNYGLPMFKNRLELVLHCLQLTPLEEKIKPEEIKRRRMYQNTGERMEEAFYLGSMLFLYMGTEKAPIYSQVLRHFSGYQQYLIEE